MTQLYLQNLKKVYKMPYTVYEYCQLSELSVNVDKTKVVIFSRGKISKHRNFFFGSLPLEVVEEYVYLGMCFNYNGTFTKAIDKQIKQATKAMYSLLTKSRRLCLPIDITCDLFDKTVLPVLTYSCETWGCGNLSPVETFYKFFYQNSFEIKLFYAKFYGLW